MTTAFVDSCVDTITGSAVKVERGANGRPRAKHLLGGLAGKKNILITTHIHPDPDALGSALALQTLLEQKLSDKPQLTMSVKGNVGGGLNNEFLRLGGFKLFPWDEATLSQYDAIILLDTQPQFSFSPLPADVKPTMVIDHHRGRRGRKPDCPFCDIRPDVGATSSIIFSYFMELEVAIKPDLAAILLYAIESDLAGAAGAPGELDNIALSSLTLLADPRKLYQMRYVQLPQGYFNAYHAALSNAIFQDTAVASHLDKIDSVEQPAIMADFLLRFDKAQWSLVSALTESKKVILSLRTNDRTHSAADAMRRILRKIGEGGGHRSKAGGFVDVSCFTPAEIEKLRKTLWRRFLRAVGLKSGKPQRLVATATTAPVRANRPR